MILVKKAHSNSDLIVFFFSLIVQYKHSCFVYPA